MKKKILTLVLTATTAAMLAGCGNAAKQADSGEAVIGDEAAAETDTAEGTAGEPECTHEWVDATCTEAKHCSICGATEGEPLPHTWVEATYETPKTCSVCGTTEGEPKQSYFDEHGVNVPDGPVDCTMDYIYYNPDDPETYCRVGDAVFTQTDCYAEPADEEGYQNVHLKLTVTMQPGYYYDAAEDVTYSRVRYTGSMYDWYTGRKLPGRGTNNDDAQEYDVTLDIDGVSYEVSYSQEVSWEQGEWVHDEAGNATISATATEEYVFRIPEGYDGLVFGTDSKREYSELDTETVSGLDEAEYADLDPTDEETEEDKKLVEDQRFFRINHTEIPVREAEAGTEDAAGTETAE